MVEDVQEHVACWLQAYLELDHAAQTGRNSGVLVPRLSVAHLLEWYPW